MLVKQVFKEIYSEDHLQARAPLLDHFAKKWGKLQIPMKIFEESFLDCFDIDQKIVIRHGDVGIRLGKWVRFEILFLNTFLSFDCRELSSGQEHIQIQTANFKTVVNQLDKDLGKQLKKMRSVMKKRSGSLVKLDKKIKEKREKSLMSTPKRRKMNLENFYSSARNSKNKKKQQSRKWPNTRGNCLQLFLLESIQSSWLRWQYFEKQTRLMKQYRRLISLLEKKVQSLKHLMDKFPY